MDSSKKIQCWDYNNCGHGKDGFCPAADQKAGRSCWLVPKTLCGGKVHGEHTQRTKSCETCSFHIFMGAVGSNPSLENQLYLDVRGVEIRRSDP